MDSNETLIQLIDESIMLELNLAALYRKYSEISAEDANFWHQLSKEEGNHAALLRSGKEYFLKLNLFPMEMVCPDITHVAAVNKRVDAYLANASMAVPSRKQAFETALTLEESAGELHFQNALEVRSFSKAMQVFSGLNQNDKNHALRIKGYREVNGLV